MSSLLELYLALVFAHLLADYPLQGAFLAEQKVNALRTEIGTHALTAHALIQGGAAAVVLTLFGYPWWPFTAAVAGTHWAIDLGKIRGLYGLSVDQLLHVAVLALAPIGVAVDTGLGVAT